MDTLFASGRAADIVLAVLAIEAIVLSLRHARSGAGPPPRVFAPMIGAGVLLVLALRCALTGAPWPWIALLLSGGGAVHAVDLWQRWRR
ncbi:MAG TPA: hypothetical protein PLX45_01955 [Piscinibacter sp.]|nr:hypothetical protein [Piscinibacter sp.]HPM64982.1 hypothetical protein [Piscinibacter sp.]